MKKPEEKYYVNLYVKNPKAYFSIFDPEYITYKMVSDLSHDEARKLTDDWNRRKGCKAVAHRVGAIFEW